MRRIKWSLVRAALLLPALFAAPAVAQRPALETLGVFQLWKTDDGSRLLERNGGDPTIDGTLQAWAVYQPFDRLEFMAIAKLWGALQTDSDADADVELLSMRITPSRWFALEAGKILMPIGNFGLRRFANVNPLIGMPDLYPPQYPWGIVASGATGVFDYRAALVSLPAVNPEYSPGPGHRLRPVVGGGFRLGPAFHLGISATHGPYLGPDVENIPADHEWNDYKQTIVASDLRFSYGDVETRAELAWSSYDAPLTEDALEGFGGYAEARITHTPRLFSAIRVEHFAYPFIEPRTATRWTANVTTQRNGEIGLGYFITPSTLIKTSARFDSWPEDPAPNAPPAPDGYAFALQFSRLTRW